MQKQQILSEMRQIYTNRHIYLSKMKDCLLFGYMCRLTPIEILLAGGVIPVELFGERRGAKYADSCVGSNICPFARSVFDDALSGKYSYLDGVVFPHSCDIVTKIYDLWRENINDKNIYQIWIPHVVSKMAVEGLVYEMKKMAKWVETISGIEVTEARLAQAVRLCNESRFLLKELHRLCEEGRIKGSEFVTVALLRGVIAPAEWNRLAKELIDKAPEECIEVEVRLMLSAAAVEDLQLVDMVESFGGNLSVHEYCDGLRSCHKLIEEDGDIWRNMAEFYMKETMCQRFFNPGKRDSFINEIIDRVPIDGVITYGLSNCDCFLFEEIELLEKLEKRGIPALALHVNYEAKQNEQMRTRVEAFMEMVKGGKK